MDIEEIKGRLDRMRDTLLRGGKFDIDWAVEVLSAVREHLDDAEDDGFVILPVPRYEALREAEETLQETRFAPDGEEDEKQATIDALTRRVNALAESNLRWARDYAGLAHHVREQRAENDRLKATAKGEIRHLRAGRGKPEAPRVKDEVFLKHIQDLQAELDGIKGRLDAQDKAVGETLSTIFDRLGATTARLNKIEVVTRPIGPIRDPALGPEARKRVDEAKERLLEEAGRATDGVGSTRP